MDQAAPADGATPRPPKHDATPPVDDATPRPPVDNATPLPSYMLSGECTKDGPAKEACLHCRRSKVKCAGGEEGKKCVRCARLGYDCQGAGPSMRGLPGVFGSERFKTSRERAPASPSLVLARAHLLIGAADTMQRPVCAGVPIAMQRYATATPFGRPVPPSGLRLLLAERQHPAQLDGASAAAVPGTVWRVRPAATLELVRRPAPFAEQNERTGWPHLPPPAAARDGPLPTRARPLPAAARQLGAAPGHPPVRTLQRSGQAVRRCVHRGRIRSSRTHALRCSLAHDERALAPWPGIRARDDEDDRPHTYRVLRP
ncbi:hypothetical protein T492DRAFT_924746 [Pavlovales sp. CCMP2436]|nr:hypothetical protein T492DRAFT_924746 [Pavlovales sp. CCMP2436]